jgi:hypothetical protein
MGRLSASKIFTRLYQGPYPPYGYLAQRAGADIVVFCARELQPDPPHCLGTQPVYVPLHDDIEHSAEAYTLARQASRWLYNEWRKGKTILVTCAQGRNRSGLVMALLLMRITNAPPAEVIDHIKGHRKDALTNSAFVRRLMHTPRFTLRQRQ